MKQNCWSGPSLWGWALLLLVVITAVFLRVWQFGDIPPGLYRDEAYNGIDALRVLDGNHALFFAANNGREPVYIYLTALAVSLLGRTAVAVRVAAAVVGSLTTVFVYLMGREWFDRRVGLLAAWLWAIALWPMHLSRIGLRPVLLPFALALAGWLAALAFRRQTNRLWLLAGAAYGFTFYTYLAARFTPLLVVAIVAFLWWRGPRAKLWPGLLWFGVGTVILLAPWFILFAQQPELILGRTGQVSIFNNAVNEGRVLQT
ncbi:MAG: glycosyltransferase family 39 protein, partial [Anaerolineales bacterium]|nr:glycosyltransferase family 39 protein [Anaerolineales bacterium]